jgi:hypothetical protein
MCQAWSKQLKNEDIQALNMVFPLFSVSTFISVNSFNFFQITVPPQGLTSFTEDSLLRHSQFVVDQVCNSA